MMSMRADVWHMRRVGLQDLQTENAALKAELANLDPEFWQELKDLISLQLMSMHADQ